MREARRGCVDSASLMCVGLWNNLEQAGSGEVGAMWLAQCGCGVRYQLATARAAKRAGCAACGTPVAVAPVYRSVPPSSRRGLWRWRGSCGGHQDVRQPQPSHLREQEPFINTVHMSCQN
jgi:hypothetical protein